MSLYRKKKNILKKIVLFVFFSSILLPLKKTVDTDMGQVFSANK